jgi:hypothetical protein
MKLNVVASTAIGLLLALPSLASAQTSSDSKAEITKVVENFRLSIINKDKVAFMKLFLREDIPWIGVTPDASLEIMAANARKAQRPEPSKLYTTGNPRSFIEGIAGSEGMREETFSNVRIDTDDDVAQVYFDYSFNQNGYKSNWGKESWHLVRGADGWKITSVIWSATRNTTPPPAPPATAAAKATP